MWHVGHRIARSMYNHADENDVIRCWNPRNLFAQWQTENFAAGVKLPNDAALLALKDLWPTAWKDNHPSPEERIALEKRARWGLKLLESVI